MTSPSEDQIVISPRIIRVARGTASAHNLAERHLTRLGARGGPLHRILQAKHLSRALYLTNMAKNKMRTKAGAQGAGWARAAFSTGPMLLLAGLASAAAIVTGLAMGRSLAEIGQDLNNAILGDLDDKARASAATRSQMGDDTLLTTAKRGAFDADQKKVWDNLYAINYRKELGRSLMMKAFPVDTTMDMLVKRAKVVWERVWKAKGGDDAVIKLAMQLSDVPVCNPFLGPTRGGRR